jgi:hypothetical protein
VSAGLKATVARWWRGGGASGAEARGRKCHGGMSNGDRRVCMGRGGVGYYAVCRQPSR